MLDHILFMGSPDFACPCLKALIEHYPNSQISVCTQADKPYGRNKKITPTPIKTLALSHKIKVYTPKTKQELSTQVNSLKPDLIIVVAYGFILEKTITDNFLCINVHASLLPKYRGATPMQAALLNNDKQTGITLIKMDDGCDTGPILDQCTHPIHKNDNIQHLHDALSQLGATTLLNYLKKNIETSNIHPKPQENTSTITCQKINKADLKLNLEDPPQKNLAKIRAYSPFPGAFILIKNKRFKILKARITTNYLDILVIQPEGKKAMTWQEACSGYKDLNGLPNIYQKGKK
ncbi:MAG: methionyl-tRNA formyltransferase [bacterium]